MAAQQLCEVGQHPLAASSPSLQVHTYCFWTLPDLTLPHVPDFCIIWCRHVFKRRHEPDTIHADWITPSVCCHRVLAYGVAN